MDFGFIFDNETTFAFQKIGGFVYNDMPVNTGE